MADDVVKRIDDAFDSWSKGQTTTQRLSRLLKKNGLSHTLLDPRQNAGSTSVFDASGQHIGDW